MSYKEYEQKLLNYIQAHGIAAQQLVFEQSTHSVEEAAAAVSATPQDFVKNLCLLTDAGRLVVAIVKGEDRLNTSAAAKAVGAAKVRMATADEILARTGYPVGGTPSFGFEAHFLVDERVMEKEIVYTGGGSPVALVKIGTDELLRANGGRVVAIRK
jgi:Cys-tRNA(Pro)/Cys-tRNA(Cys) deacylase